MYDARRKVPEPVNPSGLCFCGCGQVTPIATQNKADRGYYKGQHVRYVLGHQVPEGSDNPGWKGGKWIRSGGYVMTLKPDHPEADKDGYVYEHRLVAEQKIGRQLERHERVHHINGIKDDNDPENLVVMESQSAHMKDHGADWLVRYGDEHPEHRREAGRKGAEARWGKRKG